MTKSLKRRAHDERKKAEKALLAMAARGRSVTLRCNCENRACEHSRPYREGVPYDLEDPSTHSTCREKADPMLRIVGLGSVCAGCYANYPEEYRVSWKNSRYTGI